MEPDAVEIRVVGCLLEKQRTTPDAYPLSLNALRLACNQATNRDPVVEYDEATVREALRRLAQRGWTRLASGPGSRAPKYRQVIEEGHGLEPGEGALLAVLMLRGAQTPGETEADATAAPPTEMTTADAPAEDRLERFERELAQLREELRHLRAALGDPD
jgi:uncharacterized protein YceH (UPF0502 family)